MIFGKIPIIGGVFPEMMNRRPHNVAIIDNSIDSSVYDPIRHWVPFLPVKWASFKAKKHCFPNLDKEYSHIILTGSEASILERKDWVNEEAELVAEAVEREIPILGSCYGHQLLALALGGPSWVAKSPHPEVGWISIQIKKKDDILGNQDTAFAFSSHFDEVVFLDDDYEVLASSAHCPIQAFGMKGKPVWGIQMHPEMNIQEATLYIKNSISLGLETRMYYEKALEQQPRDSGLIDLIVEHFLSS